MINVSSIIGVLAFLIILCIGVIIVLWNKNHEISKQNDRQSNTIRDSALRCQKQAKEIRMISNLLSASIQEVNILLKFLQKFNDLDLSKYKNHELPRLKCDIAALQEPLKIFAEDESNKPSETEVAENQLSLALDNESAGSELSVPDEQIVIKEVASE